jgi:hypothetical protein
LIYENLHNGRVLRQESVIYIVGHFYSIVSFERLCGENLGRRRLLGMIGVDLLQFGVDRLVCMENLFGV